MRDPLLVVLEGPDFAGKSTLARRLTELYDGQATVVANGQPPADVDLRSHYEEQILEAVARGGLTVFDRLHVGELIYGPIYRGVARIDNSDRIAIDARLDAIGARKVHVDASDDVLTKRFWARGDDLVLDLDTLLSIARGYRDIFSIPSPLAWLQFTSGSSTSASTLIT